MNQHENKIGLFATGLIIAGLIISGCTTAKDYAKQIKVDLPTIGGTTTTTTQSVASESATCTCKLPLGDVVEIPASMQGGECVMPSGLDIRFDGNYEKLTGKGFHFVGNLLKDYCVITRNVDGTYKISLPCKVIDGYRIHVYGYNFPTDSVAIQKGNVCESWNKNGTFRWYVLFYKE